MTSTDTSDGPGQRRPDAGSAAGPAAKKTARRRAGRGRSAAKKPATAQGQQPATSQGRQEGKQPAKKVSTARRRGGTGVSGQGAKDVPAKQQAAKTRTARSTSAASTSGQGSAGRSAKKAPAPAGRPYVVVDGSNVAWACAGGPPLSFATVEAAVAEFQTWLGLADTDVTFIFDANFRHLLTDGEREVFDSRSVGRDVLVAPANSMDAADGLVLELARREHARRQVFVLTNDSYREFDCGQRPELAALFAGSRRRGAAGNGVHAYGITADRDGFLFSQRALGNSQRRS